MLRGVAGRVSLWNRARKMKLFLEHMGPGAETRVVDVGVGDTGFATEPGTALSHNYFEAMYPWPERITAVSDVPLPRFAEDFPMIECVTADGRRLPFEDDSFDIAYSNAVLEHVGGPVEQREFLRELCRVAPRVFVSTPNRWFPIEVHTLLPLLHWLPRRPRDWILGRLRPEIWGRVELVSRRQLLELFPETVDARVIESRITIAAIAVRSAG